MDPIIINFIIYYAQSIAYIITADFISVCSNEMIGFRSSIKCLLEIRIYPVY